MEIKFYNINTKSKLSPEDLPDVEPAFLSYRPNLEAMAQTCKKFEAFENLLVIGHGGSITSFYALYQALLGEATKRAHFLWTVDPEYIAQLKTKLSKDNTVVVAISKSGQTLTQLEALSQFLDFPVIVITEPGSSLEQMAQKMSWEVFKHPPIGGRFTAFTEVTLLPAMLCGLEVEYFLKGGQEVHALFSQENLPAKMAATLYDLEKQGFVDVLSLVYSHALVGSSNLIMQLCHESYGKNEQGQTFLVCEGPEVQHHTMQRFLGGTKNMIGVYVSTHASSQVTESVFPSQLHSTVVRGRHLFDLQKIPLHTVLNLEMQASLESATSLGLPVIHLELTSTDPASVGKWLAFWQLFAVYSSLLRKVNPFDQPAVEHSKDISLAKRLAIKNLL